MSSLSKEQSTILKGLAIMMVILHNWCHWQPYSWTLENEKLLKVENAETFYNNVFDCNHITSNLFSFWGWLGVVIFIFASGYGLAAKYEGKKYGFKDVWHSVKKFWALIIPTLIVTFVLQIVCQVALHGQSVMEYLSAEGATIAWKYFSNITFIDDILYTTDLYASTWGPWWYFSLTVQLYLLYIVLSRWNNRKSLVIAVVLSLLLQITMILIEEPLALRYVKNNFMGWMLPFCVGIWYRRYEWFKPSLLVLLLSLAIFFAGDWHWAAWLVQPFAFIVILLLLIHYIKVPAVVKRIFYEIGVISPYIFCFHPVVRYYTVHFNPYWMGTVAYIVLSILSGFCFKWVLSKTIYHNK